jgi:membrane-bound serine protease (ClpP class)
MRAIAQRRGRPEAPLEATVLEAKAYTAQEALDLGIIDVVAANVPILLEVIDGMTVMVDSPAGDREVTLVTAGLALEPVGFGVFDRILSLIADPNIAFLLISLGGLGIYFELIAPGTIFPGVFGVIALALGFVGLGNLPGNWAGAALILLAFALFIAELNVDGFGVIGLMGAASFVVGSIVLFGHFGTPDPGYPDISVSQLVLIPAVIVVIALAGVTAFASLSGRRSPTAKNVTTLLVGETGVVETMLAPEGIVHVHGERWKAVSASGAPLPLGSHVRVTQEDGALLTVEPAPTAPRQ